MAGSCSAPSCCGRSPPWTWQQAPHVSPLLIVQAHPLPPLLASNSPSMLVSSASPGHPSQGLRTLCPLCLGCASAVTTTTPFCPDSCSGITFSGRRCRPPSEIATLSALRSSPCWVPFLAIYPNKYVLHVNLPLIVWVTPVKVETL